jgi:hypothetical protein
MAQREYISQYIRYKVLKRQNFRCPCGQKLKFKSSQELLYDDNAEVGHVDHIIPLARGGTNDITNFQALCPKCNLSKGVKLPDTIKTSIMTDLDIANEIDKLKCLIATAKRNLKAYNIDTVKHWDYLKTRLELFLPNKRRVERDAELS